ncbi:MAG TPA: YybS family protein [Geobacteraceae bacterium]|nr:YybS family protein [Geobacteraceae bacterium]
MISKDALLEVIKGSAATLAFFVVSILVVFPGPVAMLFAPFPALYYSVKNGRVTGLAIVAVTTLVLSVFGPASSVFYLLQCGLISLLLAEFLAGNKGAARTIAYAAVINMLIILAAAVAYGLWLGSDVDTLVLKWVNDAVTEAQAQLLRSGLEAEDLEALQLQLREAAVFVGKTYPSLLFVGLSALAGLNLVLLKKAAQRISRQVFFGDFCRFKNPEKLVWVLIASGFALLAKNDLVTRAALNVLIVAIALYFVQGMAVAVHFFKKFQVSRFVRFIFYGLSFLQPYLMVLVAAVGLFDLWCDFRTPKKQENL